MKENIKVSIIVPVYNVPSEALRKCIESTVNQTLKDIEVILVDDGSKDNSGVICDEYSRKDDRIHVIHKMNEGLSAARNTGFDVACGDRIMFVDGDDWIEHDMCQILYDTAIKYDTDLVMCGMTRDYQHSKETYVFYLKENYLYTGDELLWLQEQLLHYNGNIGVAYSKLFRRKYLERNKIYHNSELKQGAEGLEFNIRAFENLKNAVFINKPLYHYMYYSGSISSNPTEENNYLVLACYSTIKENIKKSKNKERLEKWFDNRMLYIIITTAISGYFNPDKKMDYKSRKQNFKKFMNVPLVQESIATKNLIDISTQRRIVLFLIKHNLFIALMILGKMRRSQKKIK